MAKYYVNVVGRAFGPIEADTIKKMVADGKLTRDSKVSANRLDWVPLGEVAELNPASSSGTSSPSPFSNVPSDKVWYASNDGVSQFGPMTRDEVLQARNSGKLLPTASVWRAGEQGRPMNEVDAFRPQTVLPNAPTGIPFGVPAEKKEWYYSPDGQSGYGPFTVSDILAFVEQGRANFDMLVWRVGENSRPMRSEPAFTSPNARGGAFGGTIPNPMPQSNSDNFSNPYREEDIYGATSQFNAKRRNKKIRRLYTMMWASWCIAVVFAIFAAIFVKVSQTGTVADIIDPKPVPRFLAIVFFVVSIVASFFSAVTSFILVHGYWASIPKAFARTSPGVATGLLFVPLYNLYWCFVALRGCARDMNTALEYYAQQGKNQNERPQYVGLAPGTTLAVFYVILFVMVFFPACIPLIFADIASDLASDFKVGSTLVLSSLLLSGITFLFPMHFSGCFTCVSVSSIVSLLFKWGEFSSMPRTAAFFITIVVFVMLLLPACPLLFVFCTRKLKNAALQMNCWRAGMPSEEQRMKNGRVTLDDIMNS